MRKAACTLNTKVQAAFMAEVGRIRYTDALASIVCALLLTRIFLNFTELYPC